MGQVSASSGHLGQQRTVVGRSGQVGLVDTEPPGSPWRPGWRVAAPPAGKSVNQYPTASSTEQGDVQENRDQFGLM